MGVYTSADLSATHISSLYVTKSKTWKLPLKMIFSFVWSLILLCCDMIAADSVTKTKILVPDSFNFVEFRVNMSARPYEPKNKAPNIAILNNLTALTNDLIASLKVYCSDERPKRSIAGILGIATTDDIKVTNAKIAVIGSTERVITDQLRSVQRLAKELYQKDKLSDTAIADELLSIRMELELLVRTNYARDHENVLLALLGLLSSGVSDAPELGGSFTTSLVLNSVICRRETLTVKAQLFQYDLTDAVPSESGYDLELGGAQVRAPALGQKVSPFALYEANRGACPPNLHLHKVNEQFVPRTAGHALLGGYVTPGCWLRSFRENGPPTVHRLFMSADDLEPPLKDYHPVPLGGIVFDPPPPFPPTPSLQFDTYTHSVLIYLALTLSTVAFLEAVLRYVRVFWLRCTCCRLTEQGGNGGNANIAETEF